MTTEAQIQVQIGMIGDMLPLASEVTSQQLNKLLKTLQKYVAPLSQDQERTFGKIQRFVLKTQRMLLNGRYEVSEDKSSCLAIQSEENSTPKESQPQANGASPMPEPPMPQQDDKTQRLESQVLQLQSIIEQMTLNQNTSEVKALRIQISEYEQQISTYSAKNKILQQQYEDQLRESMDKQKQVVELQQTVQDLTATNEQSQRQLQELNQQVSILLAEQQNWQSQNLKNAKINDLFTALQMNLQQLEKTNKSVVDAQPKSLSILSQSILQLRQQNCQLTEQLKDRVSQANFDLINEQIQRYQDFMPQHLLQARSQPPPQPYLYQTNLAMEVNKICQSFKSKTVQLQRAGDKQWVYEKTGILLDIDVSERGNVVVVREGGEDIKPVLLSQYLRSQVMGVSRCGSAIQSRSPSASRSQSQNGRGLQLSGIKPAKAGYTSIRK